MLFYLDKASLPMLFLLPKHTHSLGETYSHSSSHFGHLRNAWCYIKVYHNQLMSYLRRLDFHPARHFTTHLSYYYEVYLLMNYPHLKEGDFLPYQLKLQ